MYFIECGRFLGGILHEISIIVFFGVLHENGTCLYSHACSLT